MHLLARTPKSEIAIPPKDQDPSCGSKMAVEILGDFQSAGQLKFHFLSPKDENTISFLFRPRPFLILRFTVPSCSQRGVRSLPPH